MPALTCMHAEPRDILCRCWPEILRGRDVRAVAEPGSGKTLAYLLPALPWLLARQAAGQQQQSGPGVLILVPTRRAERLCRPSLWHPAHTFCHRPLVRCRRELAQQVAAACRSARGLFGLRSACIYGGASREAQDAEVQKQPHILVATPGRLLDFVQASRLSLGERLPGLGFLLTTLAGQPMIRPTSAFTVSDGLTTHDSMRLLLAGFC